jgi:ABC-type bacteriocin/lantibiotic exporter with double-glycine peptidase domain
VYGWKLALVAISMLPVLVVLGFFQVKLMDHLQDHLRDAYGSSAALVCEQIASIRTVASLRRETAILAEFQDSINSPVRQAMISTIKSTTVFLLYRLANIRYLHSVNLLHCLSMFESLDSLYLIVGPAFLVRK